MHTGHFEILVAIDGREVSAGPCGAEEGSPKAESAEAEVASEAEATSRASTALEAQTMQRMWAVDPEQ